jgi:dsRNA-specific ribonuclease
MPNPVEDPIGRLQEYCVKHSLDLPIYDLQNTIENPQEYHMAAKVGNIVSHGYGALKKEAKKDAALCLLAKVKASGPKVTYQELNDEIKEKLVIEFKQDK